MKRNLAVRGVEHIERDGKSAGTAAKFTEKIHPLLHRGPEVGGPLDELTLVEIIWTDPDTDQLLCQLLHDRKGIIDPSEQDTLV